LAVIGQPVGMLVGWLPRILIDCGWSSGWVADWLVG